jgi:hypothetical protein
MSPEDPISMRFTPYWEGLRAVAWLVLTVAAVFLLIASHIYAWHTPWFEQRFTPTLAIAHGLPVYHLLTSGPLLGCMYAPLSYLAFLPAVAVPNLWVMFAAGSLTSTVLVLLPLFLSILFLVRKCGVSGGGARSLFLFGFAAVVFLPPLNYVATMVSADAPAICLMALSLLLLDWNLDRPRWTVAVFSSLALVLSVGCKQNMIVPAVVILAAVFFFFPRPFAWRYLWLSAIWTLCVAGIVRAVFGDWRSIYLNTVVLPALTPVIRSKYLYGAYSMYEYSAALLLAMAGAGVVWFLAPAEADGVKPRPRRFILVFFAVTAALVLPSIRNYAVIGGEINAFSHALYFLLLGAILTIAELTILLKSDARSIKALKFWILVSAYLLCASGLPMLFDRARVAIMRRTPAAMEAYRYDKKNPGEVYFPSNSMAVYLAEGKLYETDWGVMNPDLAGHPLGRQDIFRYLPDGARYIASPRDFAWVDHLSSHVAPHYIQVDLPGLEDFSVYRLER